jgi:hypothetical protein
VLFNLSRVTIRQLVHCEVIAADLVCVTHDGIGLPYDESMDDPPNVRIAVADRSSGFLRVVCPHCGFVNDLREWDTIYVFSCHSCDQPIRVVDEQ